eukprot:196332-Hanusia_phi.AAC.7
MEQRKFEALSLSLRPELSQANELLTTHPHLDKVTFSSSHLSSPLLSLCLPSLPPASPSLFRSVG